nr:ABC transporter permease [uncultured Carboxylicivirga sp.]
MKKQYILCAFRSIKRNKLPSFINIAGLAIGLSTALFALLFSYYEFTYERGHDKYERIAKVITFGNFGAFSELPGSFPQTAIDLPANFPEITDGVCSFQLPSIFFKDNVPLTESNIVLAQEKFMDIFTYQFISGHIYSDDDESICLSESMASKYFGKDNAVGKLLKANLNGHEVMLTVAGVFKDLPGNTHLKTDAIVSWNLAKQVLNNPEGYLTTDYDVYCLLTPHTNIKKLNEKIVANFKFPSKIEDCTVALMPIGDFHLNSVFENNKANLYILFIGGLIALMLSILNYVSQSSIMYTTRIQEVGIRLSNGAKAKDIFSQFMTDTAVVTLLGFGLALLFVHQGLPYFNSMMDTELTLLANPTVLVWIAVVFIITVVLAGFYPSLLMSRLKPVLLLRSSIGDTAGKSRIRNVMSTSQFVVAILLIQMMIVTHKQAGYLGQDEVVGFNADNVINVNGHNWGDLNKIKTEVLRNTAIESVTWGQSMPAMQASLTSYWKMEDNTQMANMFSCEADFLNVFHINMEEGRFFSSERETDKDNSIVVNKLMVSSMGWDNPVGKQLMVWGQMYTVIGVVSNYMAAPPIFEDTPLIIRCAGNKANRLIFRINPNKKKEAYEHITHVLREANPNYPINLKSYDDSTSQGAKSFYRTVTLINIFVLIVIVNAFLSLFGLSYFIAERNKKQIGINKIFGASVATIYWKLSKNLMLRFAIAFIIVTPISYFISNQYLTTFSYQMPLTADIYIISGSLVLMMLLVSTGFKIITAANRNPVDALRYE